MDLMFAEISSYNKITDVFSAFGFHDAAGLFESFREAGLSVFFLYSKSFNGRRYKCHVSMAEDGSFALSEWIFFLGENRLPNIVFWKSNCHRLSPYWFDTKRAGITTMIGADICRIIGPA